jgi:hypothetical protein
LPIAALGGNISLGKPVIRWMSDRMISSVEQDSDQRTHAAPLVEYLGVDFD